MFQVLTSRKLLLFVLVVLVLLGSYFYFSNYRPKSIRELKEVKAAQDSTVFEFAYPFEAAEVGTTENELGSQTTFVTIKDPISVHKFYRNVFDSKGWENYPMYKDKEFYISTYKKNLEQVKVTSYYSPEQNKTFATVEYFRIVR